MGLFGVSLFFFFCGSKVSRLMSDYKKKGSSFGRNVLELSCGREFFKNVVAPGKFFQIFPGIIYEKSFVCVCVCVQSGLCVST